VTQSIMVGTCGRIKLLTLWEIEREKERGRGQE
jgi:hypothetical protein